MSQRTKWIESSLFHSGGNGFKTRLRYTRRFARLACLLVLKTMMSLTRLVRDRSPQPPLNALLV